MFFTNYMLILMVFIIGLSPVHLPVWLPSLVTTGFLGLIYVDIPDTTHKLILHHKLQVSPTLVKYFSIWVHLSLILIPFVVMYSYKLRFSDKLTTQICAWCIIPLLVFLMYASRIHPRTVREIYLL